MLTELGKYRITSELGKGAMGVVYRAEDVSLERPVALKVMSAHLAGDRELVQRFYREARSAGKMNHPNIVVIYEIAESNGTPYIAMEFLEGESLEQLISRRVDTPVLEKLNIVTQACRGLHYAHQRQIVHRDIKPSNIMVLKNGTVKIVDFGIAHVNSGTAITRVDVRLGTPSYMSPEQIEGETVDGRSDLFSMGVVLYELLCYQRPFVSKDIHSLWFKICHAHPAPLTQVLPNCPPQLEEVIAHALAKNRDDRYQSAEDMAFALQRVSDFFKRHMVDLYLEEGRRSLEAGNLTVAKESFQRALQIDSSHDLAKSLLDQVQEQIHARRRSQKIEQSLREAKEALRATHYDDAIGLLDEVLELDPEHEAAREYKQMATERRERAREVGRRMERAKSFIADADLQSAKSELAAVLALDSKHASALDLMASLAKELAARERQRQVQQCIQDARTFLAQASLEKATELASEALELDPISLEAEALLGKIKAAHEKEAQRVRRQERETRIQEALDRNDFDLALVLAESALHDFPNDSEVLELHKQANALAEYDRKRRYVGERLNVARDYFQKEQYAQAIQVLQQALDTLPDEETLKSYLATVQQAQESARAETVRREAIQKATTLIRDRNFGSAIELLEEARSRVGESPGIRAILDLAHEMQAEELRQKRIREMVSRAQACVSEDDFDEATSILKQAEHGWGTNEKELNALLSDVRQRQHDFEQRRELMLKEGRRLLEAGEVGRALALLDTAPKAFLRNITFEHLYAQCRQELERVDSVGNTLMRFAKLMAEGNLEGAESALAEPLRKYPTDQALLKAGDSLRQEQRKLKWLTQLESAEAAARRTEYTRAIDILGPLAAEVTDVPELASRAQELEQEVRLRERQVALRQDALSAASAHIQKREFASAVIGLEKALAVVGRSPEISDLLQLARDKQEQGIREIADKTRTLSTEARFEEALRLLKQARHGLGAERIDPLVSAAEEQRRQLEQQRKQVLQKARQLLSAGDPAQAIAALDAAPKACQKNDEFQGTYAACRAELERRSAIHSQTVQIEPLIASNPARARSLLDRALEKFPEEPALLALQARLQQEEKRRDDWIKRLTETRAMLDRGQHGDAQEILTLLLPELDRASDLASQAHSLQERALQMERDSLLRQHAERDAAAEIQKSQPALLEEEATSLVGLAPKTTEPLQAAPEPEREQHVGQSLDVELPVSPVSRKPVPWRRVAIGLAAVIALSAAIEVGLHLFVKPTVSLQVHSDPAGALIHVGEESCITPNCKFDLPPGQYQVDAKLEGFRPLKQIVRLDAKRRIRSLDLLLKSVPPPVQSAVRAPAMGTLIVQAGMSDTEVFVDNAPARRTDARGFATLRLDAKAHDIRVEKSGYEVPHGQRIRVAEGATTRVVFRLAAERAKLELRGVPAGVELHLGGSLLARTDGAPLFSVAVPTGEQVLQVKQGSGTRQVATRFAPGQTLTMDWKSIAPAPVARPPAPLSPELIATQDWEQARVASDPAQLGAFLAKYPASPHTSEAKARLQDLIWARTDKDDLAAVQGYMNRFPNGQHSVEASQRVETIVWSRLNKKDAPSLRAFVAQYPNSSHSSEAQTMLAKLTKIESVPEPAKQRIATPELKGLQAALDRFNAAFEHAEPRELKQVWPRVPNRYTQAMRLPGTSFVMALRPIGEPEVNGNSASIQCQLTTRTTRYGRQESQAQKTVTVTLRKSGDQWMIIDALGGS